MYAATITDAITNEPITNPDTVAVAARTFGASAEFEEIDATEGVWMIPLKPFFSAIVENGGEFETHYRANDKQYHIVIEMP